MIAGGFCGPHISGPEDEQTQQKCFLHNSEDQSFGTNPTFTIATGHGNMGCIYIWHEVASGVLVWVRSRLGQSILTEIEVTGGTLVPSELNVANDLLELAV